MGIHLLSPTEADVMVSTAAGLCVLIILTRKFGWASIVSSLVVSELTMILFFVPIMMQRGWTPGSYRPAAFAIGFGGTFVMGAVVTVLERLRDDPEGTIGRLLALWKGQNSGGDR